MNVPQKTFVRFARALMEVQPGRLCPACAMSDAELLTHTTLGELIETGIFGLRADSCTSCGKDGLTVGIQLTV